MFLSPKIPKKILCRVSQEFLPRLFLKFVHNFLWEISHKIFNKFIQIFFLDFLHIFFLQIFFSRDPLVGSSRDSPEIPSGVTKEIFQRFFQKFLRRSLCKLSQKLLWVFYENYVKIVSGISSNIYKRIVSQISDEMTLFILPAILHKMFSINSSRDSSGKSLEIISKFFHSFRAELPTISSFF